MPTDKAELLSSLEKHNATFTTLLSLIPSQYYIAPTQEEADSKWMKNKKRKTGEEIKEHKRKAKASKLDPENNKTTVDILYSTEASTSAQPEQASSSSTSAPAAVSAPALTPLPPPTSISSLRQKLADRLASFRKNRGVQDDEEGGGPSSRDELEADLRRRRGEIRDNRRERRKEERRAAEKEKSKSKPEKSKTDVTAKGAKTQLIVPQLPAADSIQYNLSLPQSSSSARAGSSSKPHAPLKNLSNPSQALAHLQKHNAHLAGMDEEKRAAAEERERWAKAEARAEGGKIADSEKVLKKAVKRLEKGKSKSGKEWVDRKKTLAQAQATAIKKRNDNIASRNEARRNKKLGIKKKTGDKAKGGAKGGKKGGDKGKGKSRPGFEGKKSGGAGGASSGGASKHGKKGK